MVIRMTRHIQQPCLWFKAKLTLRFDHNDRDAPLVEPLSDFLLIFLVAENFFSLENDTADFIRSIDRVEKIIDEGLGRMRHISRTKNDIKAMRSGAFDRICENAKRHRHEFIIDARDFKSFYPIF